MSFKHTHTHTHTHTRLGGVLAKFMPRINPPSFSIGTAVTLVAGQGCGWEGRWPIFKRQTNSSMKNCHLHRWRSSLSAQHNDCSAECNSIYNVFLIIFFSPRGCELVSVLSCSIVLIWFVLSLFCPPPLPPSPYPPPATPSVLPLFPRLEVQL